MTQFISMPRCIFLGWFRQTKGSIWKFFRNLSFQSWVSLLLNCLKIRKKLKESISFIVTLRYHWLRNQNLGYQNVNDTRFFCQYLRSLRWFHHNRIHCLLDEDSCPKKTPFAHCSECGWFLRTKETYCSRSLCQFSCKIHFPPALSNCNL